eukprot:UN02320
MVMRNCQDPKSMALGQLCEADGSIAGFPQANTINNCGNEDNFRLISCDPTGSTYRNFLLCVNYNIHAHFSPLIFRGNSPAKKKSCSYNLGGKSHLNL